MADDTYQAESAAVKREAVISECKRYRYLLRRMWDASAPRCAYVMLNPSTADADVDDPTIRSCVRLASSMGYGGFDAVNLFAWRATDPKNIPADLLEAAGPFNEKVVGLVAQHCQTIICAWGAHPHAAKNSARVLNVLAAHSKIPYCFGVTQSGAPKHPLYIKRGTSLVVYAGFA